MVCPTTLVTESECLAFKSKNGKFLRLQKNEEGCRNLLELSDPEEEGDAHLTSPYVRFFAEPSKKHEGCIHIRCCYNNKYWVARQRQVTDGRDAGEWSILGDANEPEEDLSNPSCTLFQKTPLQNRQSSDGDHGPEEHDYELQHAGLKRAVCYMLVADDDDDSLPRRSRRRRQSLLLVGTDTDEKKQASSRDDAKDGYNYGSIVTALSAITLNSLELPRIVCFKGDNGKYLRAEYLREQGYNFLRFSTDDVGEASVMQEIHPTGSSIRISCQIKNKNSQAETFFWKLDRELTYYICAGPRPNTSSGQDYLFRHFWVDDATVALRSVGGRDAFCKRLNDGGKLDSFLVAANKTISKTAMLRVEEPVISRKVLNVKYRVKDARIHTPARLTVSTAHAYNRSSSSSQTLTLKLSFGVARVRTWDSTVSSKLAVATTIDAPVPKVFGGLSIQIQTEVTESVSWGTSDTSTEEHSVDYEITVLPRTAVKIAVLATQASYEVPFSYDQEDVLTTGEKKTVKDIQDGIFRGVNSYNFTYEVSETKL